MKLPHLVFDHQGAFLFEGTVKQIAEKFDLKYKSIHTSIYNGTSCKHFVVLPKHVANEMSMSEILAFCRRTDKRWIDTDQYNKPIYRRQQAACINTKFPAKNAESLFVDEDLLNAEINYKKSFASC